MSDPKMKSFHFDCGNSSDGPIGFCGRIRAYTKEEAVEIARRILPSEVKISPCGDDEDNARVEYFEAYINAENVDVKSIDDEEEVD